MTYSRGYREAVMECIEMRGLKEAKKIYKASFSSLRRWMKSIEGKKTRECKPRKFTQECREHVRTVLENNPLVTSAEIAASVERNCSVKVSRQFISTVIASLNFTRKSCKLRATAKNDNYFTNREAFKPRLKAVLEDKSTPVVSIDEAGFDQRPQNMMGYAPRGKPAIVRAPFCKHSHRQNLVLAISNDGTANHFIVENSVKSDAMIEIVKQMTFPPHTRFLLDNASIHRTKRVIEAFEARKYKPIFIPPYAPEFNPVEKAFSRIKGGFKKARFTEEDFSIRQGIEKLVNLCIHNDAEYVKKLFKHLEKLPDT